GGARTVGEGSGGSSPCESAAHGSSSSTGGAGGRSSTSGRSVVLSDGVCARGPHARAGGRGGIDIGGVAVRDTGGSAAAWKPRGVTRGSACFDARSAASRSWFVP